MRGREEAAGSAAEAVVEGGVGGAAAAWRAWLASRHPTPSSCRLLAGLTGREPGWRQQGESRLRAAVCSSQ